MVLRSDVEGRYRQVVNLYDGLIKMTGEAVGVGNIFLKQRARTHTHEMLVGAVTYKVNGNLIIRQKCHETLMRSHFNPCFVNSAGRVKLYTTHSTDFECFQSRDEEFREDSVGHVVKVLTRAYKQKQKYFSMLLS